MTGSKRDVVNSASAIELQAGEHHLTVICLKWGATGEPVILLHGITSSIAFWQVNPAPHLLDIGPCYSLSLPAHYPAIAPAGFGDSSLTADVVVRLLDEAIRQLVGEQPVTLIGHSTGGFAALALAAHRPEMACRLVSIAGFAHGRWTGLLGLYQRTVRLGWSGEAYFKARFRLGNLHPAILRWAMRFHAADTRALYAHPDLEEAVARVFLHYRRLDLDTLMSYFKFMPEIDITAQLPRIQAQTLVVAGDSDPIVPPEQSHRITSLINDAELAINEDAGHLPIFERPDKYHVTFSGWLERTRLAA